MTVHAVVSGNTMAGHARMRKGARGGQSQTALPNSREGCPCKGAFIIGGCSFPMAFPGRTASGLLVEVEEGGGWGGWDGERLTRGDGTVGSWLARCHSVSTYRFPNKSPDVAT